MKKAATDEGFTLIEIVTAMMLLAVLAIAFLPVLIQGLKYSAQNATMATATQILDAQFDAVQSVTSCSTLATNTISTTDSRGNALSVTRSRGACPTIFPSTVSYAVSITRVSDGAVLASGTTLIYVTGS